MSLLLRSEPFTLCEPTFIQKAAEQQGSLNIVTFQFGPIAEVVERIANGIMDWCDAPKKGGVVLRYPSGIVISRPDVLTIPLIEELDPTDPLAAYKGMLKHIYRSRFDIVVLPELRDGIDVHAALELKAAGITCLTSFSSKREELIEPRLSNMGLELTQINAILR